MTIQEARANYAAGLPPKWEYYSWTGGPKPAIQDHSYPITFINLALVPLGCSDLLVRQLSSYSDPLSQPCNAT